MTLPKKKKKRRANDLDLQTFIIRTYNWSTNCGCAKEF